MSAATHTASPSKAWSTDGLVTFAKVLFIGGMIGGLVLDHYLPPKLGDNLTSHIDGLAFVGDDAKHLKPLPDLNSKHGLQAHDYADAGTHLYGWGTTPDGHCVYAVQQIGGTYGWIAATCSANAKG